MIKKLIFNRTKFVPQSDLDNANNKFNNVNNKFNSVVGRWKIYNGSGYQGVAAEITIHSDGTITAIDGYDKAGKVVKIGGGVISLLSHIGRCLQSLLRNEVIACL